MSFCLRRFASAKDADVRVPSKRVQDAKFALEKKMSLPSFICIGAQKAGTTWLYRHLCRHNDVWMPPIKELHYFDHLYLAANREWTRQFIKGSIKKLIKRHIRDENTIDLRYINYLSKLALDDMFTETWYRNAFEWRDAKDRVTGEITPAYCAIGKDGIHYVRSFLGSVKIIYLIRDPVSRAVSQIKMNIRNGSLSPDTQSCIDFLKNPAYLNRGDYASNIPLWVDAFGKDHILFLPFKRIYQAPDDLLFQTEQFLNLRHQRFEGLRNPINKGKGAPIPKNVLLVLQEELATQQEFLKRFFGYEFLQDI